VGGKTRPLSASAGRAPLPGRELGRRLVRGDHGEQVVGDELEIAAGELRWNVTMFPTDAYASGASMSRAAFEDFLYRACLVDQPDPVAAFYDRLAPRYEAIVGGHWDRSAQRQGEILTSVLERSLGSGPLRVLDCCCGIGTQALGLAQNGHDVVATDISLGAIERARREAELRKVSIGFSVRDLRELGSARLGEFDAVICGDNSIAHMLTRDDLGRAARSIRSVLENHGVAIISLRDYDRHLATRPACTLPTPADGASDALSFQRWTWLDHSCYEAEQLLIERDQDGWSAQSLGHVRFRAWLRHEVSDAFDQAGFRSQQWLMPTETTMASPLLVASSS